jgi:endo-1,4-beta-xylanase
MRAIGECNRVMTRGKWWCISRIIVGTCVAAASVAHVVRVSVAQGLDAPSVTLKEAYQQDFRIGAAITRAQFSGQDALGDAIITAQFNTITPENALKWESVHPKADGYNFAASDAYVAYGEKNKMWIVGHCLVWHAQTPKWVFDGAAGKPISREALLERMHEHIRTVVGRYQGRIGGWDVVNEALNEDGTLRQSPWLKIIGEEYIAKAFQFAHEADPAAELYYNDYDLEGVAKRKGAIELIKKLQAQGIQVEAVGMQDHVRLEWPSVAEEAATIEAFAQLGVKVNITELDVDVLLKTTKEQMADVAVSVQATPKMNPYPGGLPQHVQQALTKRYAELFVVFVKHRDVITRVTFWGVTNGDSWLNNWPVRGRTSYPLLFDREGQTTPAYEAVIEAAAAK